MMTNEVEMNGTKKAPPKILPFQTHDGFDISTSTPAAVPCLVDPLLLEIGTSMISGKPKLGKSSFLRTLAVAVAEAKPFLGFTIPMGGDVLYMNLEGPRGVLGQHFRRLGLSGRGGRIHIVDERMPFNGEVGLQRFEETIRQQMPLKLVIVDPAAKLLRLLDSYDPNSVGLAIEHLETIAKKFNLHLMFSSHSKKKQTDDVGDGPMGSTSFRGGTDTNIFLVKDGNRRIISTEQRWGVEMEPCLLLQDETGASTLGSTVESIKESRSESKQTATKKRIRQDILTLLCQPKTLNPTKQELLKGISGNDAQVADVVAEMVEAKEITEAKDGRALRYSKVEIPLEDNRIVVEDLAEAVTI